MKTQRKLRTRRLALRFDEPLHPVEHDRGKRLLAEVIATLQNSESFPSTTKGNSR